MPISVPLIEPITEKQAEILQDRLDAGWTAHREVSATIDRVVIVTPRVGKRAARIRSILQKRTERDR